MTTTTDERDTTLVIAVADLYVGAGNIVTYYSETHGLQRRHVVAQRDDAVEVVFYANPNNGQRVSAPYSESVRTFEWVSKLDIVTVNDQRVEVRSLVECPVHGADCTVWAAL